MWVEEQEVAVKKYASCIHFLLHWKYSHFNWSGALKQTMSCQIFLKARFENWNIADTNEKLIERAKSFHTQRSCTTQLRVNQLYYS